MPAIRRSWREESVRRPSRTRTTNSWLVSMMRSRDRNTFITVIVLAFLILIILIGYAAFGEQAPPTPTSSSLQNVFILFRHGERAPDVFYPKDPYQDLKYWPEGVGQLTNKGKVEMYEVGKKWRTQYSSLLPERYSSADMQVRSSYSERCQMSVLTLLAGLYPPTGSQIWNDQIPWQPIPINSVPRNYDNMIVIGQPCPKYIKLKSEIQMEISGNFTADQKQMMEYLTVNTGKNISTLAHVESLYFNLKIEADNNLKLPEWTKQVFPDKMKPLANLMQASLAWNKKMKRFATGEMLGEWRRILTAASHEGYDKVKKMYLYSGHDVTLVSVMRSLALDLAELPDYGASLHVQLWHSTQIGYTVQVLYYRSASSSWESLVLPGCEPSCPLDKFFDLIDPLVTDNWSEECEQ